MKTNRKFCILGPEKSANKPANANGRSPVANTN